jgi:hypothetical protein
MERVVGMAIQILSIKGKRTSKGFVEESREITGSLPDDPAFFDTIAEVYLKRMKEDGVLPGGNGVSAVVGVG